MNPYDKRWYRFNDKYVSEINPPEQQSELPYILFYCKRGLMK
jgi:hypothetical protein